MILTVPCVGPLIICDKNVFAKICCEILQDELHVYGEFNSNFTVSTCPGGSICAKIAKVNSETLIS